MRKRLGFMFAGQGAQSVGMGQELSEQSDAARALFAKADQALGRDLSGLCFRGPIEDLTNSANCQPAIYAVSLACLAAFEEQCPVEPVACGGLSLGEFSALAAAGALEFADGLKLVATRGALMDEACQAAQGAMAAVLKADPELVQQVCADNDVDVANYNCPGQIVISGASKRVEQAVAALKEAGVSRVIMLTVAGAYHSRLMAPAAEKFGPVLEAARIAAPRCPVAQNVAGALVRDPDEIRRNLALQVTGSVKWEDCVRAMLDAGAEALVEFGPGQVLTGFMRRIDSAVPVFSVSGAADVTEALAALRE